MRYFLRHIAQMSIPMALLLLVCALAMWVIDYVRMPDQWLSILIAQSLVVLCAVLLCVVFFRAKASGHFSLLPALLYVVAIGVCPYLRMHWQPQLLSAALLLFLLATRDLSDTHEPNGLVFFFTLLLCSIALVVPDALWCIVLLWIVVLLQGAFSPRTVLASVLGATLVAIYYLLAMYFGLVEMWDLSVLFDRRWFAYDVPVCLIVTTVVMLFAFVTIAVGAFRRSSYDLVSTRMLFYHVVIWGLLSTPLLLFMAARPDYWVMLPFSLSSTTGIYLLQKKSETRGVTLLLYLVGAVSLYIWQTLSL